MTLTSMHDLLVHELQNLYGAEHQLIQAIPALSRAAAEPLLAAAFEERLAQTVIHTTRLEACFRALQEQPTAINCQGMAGLLRGAADMAEQEGSPLVRDAGLIVAEQRIEHYEIAAYGTCLELARALGNTVVRDLLHETMQEAHDTNVLLTYLAKTDVNPRAMLSAA